MKIIVVGLGQKGVMLADILAQEQHDVIAVDIDKAQIEKVTNKYSVSGVCGSGVSKEVLLQAGANTADVILAMTPIDEVNLMICMVAKDLGTRYAGARLFRPELSNDEEYLAKEFKVDYIINPKLETAKEIARQMGLPGKVKADAYFSNTATLISVTVEKGMFPKDKLTIEEIKAFFATDMLVATVTREDEIVVPHGEYVVEIGDVLGIVAADEALLAVIQKLGLIRKAAKKIFVVGGGDIAYYLSKILLEKKLSVKVLESSKRRCSDLYEKLPELKVCYADGLKEEILFEEGLKESDACVSLTGSDENNLVVSLFAWSCGIPSIITKVDSADYAKLLNRVNIDITVSPNVITVNGMLGFVRNVAVYNDKGNDINGLYQLAGGKAEAVEFVAYDNSKGLGIPFKSEQFKLKKQILVAMLVRDGKTIIPDGDDCIKSGDRVVVITQRRQNFALNTLNDIFK